MLHKLFLVNYLDRQVRIEYEKKTIFSLIFFEFLIGKSQFVVFSDKALILPRDNKLTLAFRIGNLSVSQLISATVRLLMIRQRQTKEGEIIPHQIYDMELTHLRNGQLFFPRPTIVEHIIDSRSPLYGIQRSTLEKEHFEIIAIIEGAFDYTGFQCHFRTSYLPNELLWGYQFQSCNSTLDGFDYQKFNQVKLVDAQPFWIYEDEQLSNSPSAPNSPCSYHPFMTNNSKKKLQKQTSMPINPSIRITTADNIHEHDQIENFIFE